MTTLSNVAAFLLTLLLVSIAPFAIEQIPFNNLEVLEVAESVAVVAICTLFLRTVLGLRWPQLMMATLPLTVACGISWATSVSFSSIAAITACTMAVVFITRSGLRYVVRRGGMQSR